MEDNNIQDYGKQVFDKIPDIAFDWYARLVPGIIGISLLVITDDIKIDFLSKNLGISILIAYLIGHITQPFSSGILQKKYSKLKEKKGPLLSKAYSELVGFFSCVIFTFAIIIYKIINQFVLSESAYSKGTYVSLILSLLLFLLAVNLRRKAYYRKYKGQTEKIEKSKKSDKKND